MSWNITDTASFFLSPWQNSCQEFAGALAAGVLTSVRSLQVPCRYPDQCQEFAGACPADILTSVRSCAEIGPLHLRLSVS